MGYPVPVGTRGKWDRNYGRRKVGKGEIAKARLRGESGRLG